MSSQQQNTPLYNQNKTILYAKSFRQSFSGSETDVSNSTSTENLTQEEKHVLRHSTRQEPQGEENTLNNNNHYHQQSSSFVMNSAASSTNNTLRMHNYNSLKRYLSTNNKFDDSVVRERMNLQNLKSDANYDTSNIETNYNTVMSSRSNSVPPPRSFRVMSHEPVITSSINQNLPTSQQQPPKYEATHHPYQVPNLPPYHLKASIADENKLQHDSLHYSHQPVLDISQLPPPPEYPKAVSEPAKLKEENEKLCMSEPELMGRMHNRPKTHGCITVEHENEYGSETPDMVAALSAENIMLKEELEHYYMKVSKLHKVEDEVFKVHNAHEELVKTSEKREKLERAVRVRLDLEVKRLQDNNKRLKEQLQLASSKLKKEQVSSADETDLKKELHKRDMLISQLITQNKELVSDKERQEIELSAQRATLQEQRNHIDIMDNALTNAQANVVKLEEECRKKHAYVERVSQLQKALTSLQTACDKRELMEKKLRSKLEKEIDTLRKQKSGKQSSEESFSKEAEMKKQIRQHEEKIIALEAEVFKWEQRYLEESAMRQIAIDNASMPKDAKIAALEKTSQENEKLITEARTEKLKQMDELYQSQRKCADIETRIKDLESKLAEKEAMIKVLQKHSVDKSEVIQNAMLRSPRHSPHPSILHVSSLSSTTPISSSGMSTSEGTSNVSNSIFAATSCDNTMNSDSNYKTSGSSLSGIVYHKKFPSQSGIGAISISGSKNQASDDSANSCTSTPTNCSSSTEKSLDEQLKDVESQLSSKDSIISALRAEKQKYPNHFWRV